MGKYRGSSESGQLWRVGRLGVSADNGIFHRDGTYGDEDTSGPAWRKVPDGLIWVSLFGSKTRKVTWLLASMLHTTFSTGGRTAESWNRVACLTWGTDADRRGQGSSGRYLPCSQHLITHRSCRTGLIDLIFV